MSEIFPKELEEKLLGMSNMQCLDPIALRAGRGPDSQKATLARAILHFGKQQEQILTKLEEISKASQQQPENGMKNPKLDELARGKS